MLWIDDIPVSEGAVQRQDVRFDVQCIEADPGGVGAGAFPGRRVSLKNYSRHRYNDAMASYSTVCAVFASNSVDIGHCLYALMSRFSDAADGHLDKYLS